MAPDCGRKAEAMRGEVRVSSDLRQQRLAVRGIETDLFTVGEGKPLLFLHSGAGPDCFSTEYLETLGKSFHVIAPFHPGFGMIGRPSHFRDVGDLAYFYLDLIDKLDLRDIALVGAALGGWIATEIAVRSTGRLSHLILADPFGVKFGNRETRDFLDFLAVSREERAQLEFNHPIFQNLSYAGKTDEQIAVIARGLETEAFYGWQPFMHNPQLLHWLHRIDVPTLILRGSDDRVVAPANHRAYLDRIPDSRIQMIEAAGHHPHLDRPQEFSAAVSAFLNS